MALEPVRGELAVGCAFFNPFHSELRVANFRRFRAGIRAAGVPMLTVELTFDEGPSELGDLEDVLTVRDGDVLWQKEGLLRLAGHELIRRGADQILFLDADIRFLDPDWPRAVRQAFGLAPLIQPFEYATRDLGREERVQRAVAANHRVVRGKGVTSYGLGWGMHSQLFEAVSLFPHCVIGGGDRLISYGASLRPGTTPDPDQLAADLRVARYVSHEMRMAMAAWMAKLSAAIDGRWHYAETAVESFFHCSPEARNYEERHKLLERFDPVLHLATDSGGALRWSAAGRDRYAGLVSQYLEGRAVSERQGRPRATGEPV